MFDVNEIIGLYGMAYLWLMREATIVYGDALYNENESKLYQVKPKGIRRKINTVGVTFMWIPNWDATEGKIRESLTTPLYVQFNVS